MIGSAVAAMISVGFGVQALSIGVGGLPGILSIKSDFYLPFLLAMAAAIIIPFILTLIVGSRKLRAEERYGDMNTANAVSVSDSTESTLSSESAVAKSESPASIKSILDGKVLPIEEAPDDVFSQKIMGDGVAIEPTSNTVVAPADAEITVVMTDTGHACGLKLANNMELLIHVGVDTVNMGGDGFELKVSQGDHVKCGDPLITFDPDKIAAAGHPSTTMLIVVSPGDAQNITMHSGMDASSGETTVISWE